MKSNWNQSARRSANVSTPTWRIAAARVFVFLTLLIFCGQAGAALFKDLVASTPLEGGAVPLVTPDGATPIYYDSNDDKGVIRAIGDLQADTERVTGKKPEVSTDSPASRHAIIVGTLGKSAAIDALVAQGKIKEGDLKGKWESFVLATVQHPMPGVDDALVIAGSDRRGTIYGIYEMSEQLGVSPWYWWADVPPKKRAEAYAVSGYHASGEPAVKYRGIFINDESPSFTGWANAKFGGLNSKMYVHVFELLLRLKANYLWPAMWGNAFNEDDPLNPVLANEYGIVMGTSHHEPMMRAHNEYTRRRAEVGPWDYVTNADRLKKFFREGLEHARNFDNIITISMRGDGDAAMGNGDDAANIKVLKNVIADQRQIISDVYGRPASEVPQLWAIFTEVQRYYDAGLTVPDDVTLLFCDNNWGYIRRIGPAKEKDRKGGMGLYYHIDMNGGPWNDRWINTTTIPKLREQLNLAYQTGLNRIWIVNVGDIKPKEYPIDFIMRYAWNPNAIPADKVGQAGVEWATSIFGPEHAEEIARIVATYSKYNLLRKPEVESTDIFSYVNYDEAGTMLEKWRTLAKEAEDLAAKIPPEQRDAYYELVEYPAVASAGVAEIYLDAGRNNLYAEQGRVSANDLAQRARALFDRDKELSDKYNTTLADGKWRNMMSDVHIGYRQWSMPRQNQLPTLREVTPLSSPTMGVAIEGSREAWPGSNQTAQLPPFDAMSDQRYSIDVFNRGTGSFTFTAEADQPWVHLSANSGTVDRESRLFATVDWKSAPIGESNATITISNGNTAVPVALHAINQKLPSASEPYYGSLSGEFSIPANKFNANIPGKNAKWIVLPGRGRGEACMGADPVTAPSADPASEPASAPRLEYRVYLPKAGKNRVRIGILPTQDVDPARGLRLGIALDDNQPHILDARKGLHDEFKEYTPQNLARAKNLKPLPPLEDGDYMKLLQGKRVRSDVFDDMRWLDVDLAAAAPGLHTIKLMMVDPEVVVEKLIVNPDDTHPSYFGAPPVRHPAGG